VIINGYNFSDTALDIRVTANGDDGPVDGISIVGQKRGSATATRIELQKDFGSSGYLTVYVDGVPSINNINESAGGQDSESVPSNPRSRQWTDDRYVHVFEVTQMLSATANSTFYYPSMVMDGNQPVFTYTNDNEGSNRRTTGDSTSARRGYLWYERQTAVDRDTNGNYYIVSAQDAFSGNDIGYLYVNRDREQQAAIGGGATGNNHIELVGEDYNSRQLNRFRYPRINVDGPDTGARVYVATYDAHPLERDLKFFAFRMTGATVSNLLQPAADNQIATNGWISVPGTSGGNSSQYFDMLVVGDATDAGHIVVIPIYDETNSTLRLLYAHNPVDGNGLYAPATAWREFDVETIGSYAGTFVSAATDGVSIYLSYYDSSSSDLKLAVVPVAKLAAGGPGSQSVPIYTIDAHLSVGTWTNTTVIGGVPHISYYSDSYNGTRSPIRLAYPRGTIDDGVLPGTSDYSGAWEVIAVPALSVPIGGMPEFNRTQIDFYTDGAPRAVIGWTGARPEYAKLKRTP
jgi:hypothetical protein